MLQQVLNEKCKGLERTVDARDKALQQKQMVLKFRQETIKKLEKSIKETDGSSSDDKNTIIVSISNDQVRIARIDIGNEHKVVKLGHFHNSERITNYSVLKNVEIERLRTIYFAQENLKVELQAASSINEHHPEVAKLNYINKKLSAELSKLKNNAAIAETTEKNKDLQARLERTFKELQQEQPDQG